MTVTPLSLRSPLSQRAAGLMICAWCGEELVKPELQPELPRTSHGICPPCALEYFGLCLEARPREEVQGTHA